MSDNRAVASGILTEAEDTIANKRPGVHGSAEQSFDMIAELWSAYLVHKNAVKAGIAATQGETIEIDAVDVAQMMAMMKIARAVYGDPTNRDNFVDAAGYTALAGMLQLPDPDAVMGYKELVAKTQFAVPDTPITEQMRKEGARLKDDMSGKPPLAPPAEKVMPTADLNLDLTEGELRP